MIVVSDTGPLISLMKAGQLMLLQRLYQEILIPEAVYQELTSNWRYESESTCAALSVFSCWALTANCSQRRKWSRPQGECVPPIAAFLHSFTNMSWTTSGNQTKAFADCP